MKGCDCCVGAGDDRGRGEVEGGEEETGGGGEEEGAAGEVDDGVAVGGDGAQEGGDVGLGPGHADEGQEVTQDVGAGDGA